jgi:multisubunit Na+/H+ antiporter MnhB subunit
MLPGPGTPQRNRENIAFVAVGVLGVSAIIQGAVSGNPGPKLFGVVLIGVSLILWWWRYTHPID